MSGRTDPAVIAAMSIEEGADIQAALAAIDRGGLNTAFLTAPHTGTFCGLVTDGDIRRALLDGYGLRSPVRDIPRPKATTANLRMSAEKMTELLSESVRVLPVLDDGHRVVDVAIYDRRVHLPVASPSLGGNELRYVTDCLLTGWISSAGKYVTRFEEMFAEFCGTKHAVTTSNGTTCLHLALVALGIGPGDEVIVPSLTFIATANAVAYTGATPVFVDSEVETWNMDPVAVQQAISPRTKAIIPVHLYGLPVNMERLLALADAHKLMVVEDAAQAHGALFHGRRAGSIGIAGTFSFYGNKTITTGEGGMLVTNDDEVADRARLLRDHGMSKTRRYWHPVIGYNYRMTNMQAAVGVAQMERVESILEHKRSNAREYTRRLDGIHGVSLQRIPSGLISTHWLFSFAVNDNASITRDELMTALAAEGVETRPVFPPVHKMPPYDNGLHLVQAERMGRCGISLPSGPEIGRAEVERICDIIQLALGGTSNI